MATLKDSEYPPPYSTTVPPRPPAPEDMRSGPARPARPDARPLGALPACYTQRATREGRVGVGKRFGSGVDPVHRGLVLKPTGARCDITAATGGIRDVPHGLGLLLASSSDTNPGPAAEGKGGGGEGEGECSARSRPSRSLFLSPPLSRSLRCSTVPIPYYRQPVTWVAGLVHGFAPHHGPA